MAVGTKSDFKIYDDQYYGGQFDKLAQNIEAFNTGSNGCIRLGFRALKGEFEKQSFMKRVSGGLIARRDPTAVTAVTSKKLEQGENVRVKINRRIGPVEMSRDSWRKIGESPERFSFEIGRMVAEEKPQEMVNTAIACLVAAIKNQAGATKTLTTKLDHTGLAGGLQKFGDQQQRIGLWVMHSMSNYQLIEKQIGEKSFEGYSMAIFKGSAATLNKPVLMIDAPALFTADPDGAGSAVDTYTVLGLVPGAIEVEESEKEDVLIQPVSGYENITDRLQGEYAYNVGILGYTWDVANGGANPNDAALATGTNWDLTTADVKNSAGIAVVHNAA